MSKATSEAQTAPLSAESARPNIVVSDERVKELYRAFATHRGRMQYADTRDILLILQDYSSLRAEVERWKDEAKAIEVLMLMADGDRTIFKARAEKAEAELVAVRADRDEWEEAAKGWREANYRLQFKLAKVAPLVEAVMETDIFQYHDPETDCPIITAALKYREGEK
jgi:hypothetical protein